MIAAWAAVAVFGLAVGFIADDASLLIFGFFCALMAMASLLARDVRTNNAVIFDQDYLDQHRVGRRHG